MHSSFNIVTNLLYGSNFVTSGCDNALGPFISLKANILFNNSSATILRTNDYYFYKAGDILL